MYTYFHFNLSAIERNGTRGGLINHIFPWVLPSSVLMKWTHVWVTLLSDHHSACRSLTPSQWDSCYAEAKPLTLSVKTTPSFHIWYLTSMEFRLERQRRSVCTASRACCSYFPVTAPSREIRSSPDAGAEPRACIWDHASQNFVRLFPRDLGKQTKLNITTFVFYYLRKVLSFSLFFSSITYELSSLWMWQLFLGTVLN